VFTGLIGDLGTVEALARDEKGATLAIRTPLAGELAPGDSIAVNGVCLTAVEVGQDAFTTEAMPETLARSSLGALAPGGRVNLELAMRAGDRLGGHIVQGHVDGTGTFIALDEVPGADNYSLRIEIPPDLARYVIFKGSLSIEGISLTVAKVEGAQVTVAVIPHTTEMTNLKSLKPGDPVNLEVDMIAKYVEKMMQDDSTNSSITIERLVEEGF
jgi:riboflavin synthase